MLASEIKRSSPSQLDGAGLSEHCEPAGKNGAGMPESPTSDPTLITKSATSPAPSVPSPLALPGDLPMFIPWTAMNCASAHWAATVVSSFTVTKDEDMRL